MATGRWKVYDAAKRYIALGVHALDETTDWRVALFGAGSNANDLTHDVFGDLTGELATGNGYTAGGASVSGQTLVAVDGVTTFDSDDAQWTAAGGPITARYAVYYRDATIEGVVKPLLCVCVLELPGNDVTATDGNTFGVAMAASGILSIGGGISD